MSLPEPEVVGTPPPVETRLWEGKRIMLAFPWMKTSNPRTVFSLMAMLDRRRMMLALDFGDSFVQHARNKLADGFLKSGLEWVLYCDDDNVAPFGNAALYNSFTGFSLPDKFAGMHGIDRLMSHGKTFIGGMYRGRWPHSKAVFSEGPTMEKYIEGGPRDEVRPTRWIGFGFVLIHRTVFLDIEKKFPHLARGEDGNGGNFFTSSEHDLRNSVDSALQENDPKKIKEILERGKQLSQRNSCLGVGEDVQFAHRAAQAGHQCFVDLGLVVGHLGEYCYGYGTKRKIL